MSLEGGSKHRQAIRIVAELFGDDRHDLVFFGSCVLALYVPGTHRNLRTTKDVDCISTVEPWIVKNKLLAELSAARRIRPDQELQCRYWITAQPEICFDIVHISGTNVGARNAWVERAARCATEYDADGLAVKAITPPYFLATKLHAHLGRGGDDDPRCSQDIEDAIALLLEVPDVVDQLVSMDIHDEVADLWQRIRHKHRLLDRDEIDLVRAGLDSRDQEDHAHRIAQSLARLR